MDVKSILVLMDKMNQIGLSRIEVTEKDFSVKLERMITPDYSATVSAAPTHSNAAQIHANASDPSRHAVQAPAAPAEKPAGHELKSPIVGTFYASSSPDSPPFVSIGQFVKKGDVVCVIEAMKMFNEIQSDFDGVVKDICVKNGDTLEFGQCIMIIG